MRTLSEQGLAKAAQKAVEKIGTQAEVARRAGISRQAVYQALDYPWPRHSMASICVRILEAVEGVEVETETVYRVRKKK